MQLRTMQISAGYGFKVANALVSAQPNKGNLKRRRIVNLYSSITYIVNVNILFWNHRCSVLDS